MDAASLVSLAVRVAGEPTLDRVLNVVAKGLAEQPEVALARIWLMSPGDLCDSCFMRAECRDQTQCLHLVASAGRPHNSPGEDWSFLEGHFRRVPLGARKAGAIGATGTPILIRDLAPRSDWIARPEWAQREAIRSFAGHPLVFAGKTLGVLAIFSRQPLDDQDFTWLRMFADQAAAIIANVQVSENLHQAEEALRERERLIHAFWDHSSNLIFLKDPEGRYIFANQQFAKAFRLSQAQIEGKKDDELFPPDQANAFRANDLQVLRAGAAMEFEEVAVHDDGPHTSIVQKFPLLDAQGGIYAMGGIVTDITARTVAEEGRRHSEERYRSMIETATDAVVGVDQNSQILFVNPAATRIFGYESSELIGQSLTMLMPECLRQLHKAGLQRYLASGRRHLNWAGTELVAVRKSGEEFPAEVSFGELARNNNHIFTGFIRDISERKQAEEKLRQSERHLRLVTETIPQMLWSADPDGGLDFINQHGLDYTGLSADEIRGSGWMKCVHPDDVDALAKHWLDCASRGTAFRAEFRCRHAANHSYRWCLSSAMPLRDAGGQIVKWYGSVIDLHDWKEAQDALRAAEVRFRLLVEGVQDYAIFMVDPEGRVMTWNTGAERIKGYTTEEIVGQHVSRFYEEADAESGVPHRQLEVAASTGRFEDEGWRRRKDGSRFWANVILTPIRAEDGKLLGFAKVTRDLTERRRLEQTLKHERDRLHFLLDLNNKVVSHRDLRQLFRVVVAALRPVMDCKFVGLALPDPDGQHLRQSALDYVQGRDAICEGMVLPIRGSASGYAFRTGKPFVLQSAVRAMRDPEIYGTAAGESFYTLVTKEGFRSGCFLPLVMRNTVLGILQVTRHKENEFDQDDIDFLSQVARQIAFAVDNALHYEQVNESRGRLAAENLYLAEEIRREHNFDEIVGNSAAILELLRKVELAGPTDSSVLISGETGTGKELIARAIHARSARKDHALVKVNCGSIPAGLVESELFGHVKGAFTGATGHRTGRFEIAHKGTVFLDEVGELPLETQVKLLRVLQEQEFEPVGSSRTVHVDVRIIAATNRNLEVAVQAGQFRSDLYYRLNVLPLHVPPLRERASDISQLVMYFLERFSRKVGKKIEAVSQQTMDLLVKYSWPGNIRELQNVIERGVVMSQGSVLTLGSDFLPVEPQYHTNSQDPGVRRPANLTVAEGDVLSLEETERRHILSVLERTGGVINGNEGAAAVLRIHPSTLRSRMKKLGITRRGDDIS